MGEVEVKLFRPILAVLGLCAVVAACQSNTKFKEDMLSSAGFKATPPTTPAQVASLKSLPPHKLTRTTHKGRTLWVYSDPTICGCLYVGNQAAYDAYLRKQSQQATFDMNSVAVPNEGSTWDFGVWPDVSAEP
jgi:hypothetical protein